MTTVLYLSGLVGVDMEPFLCPEEPSPVPSLAPRSPKWQDRRIIPDYISTMGFLAVLAAVKASGRLRWALLLICISLLVVGCIARVDLAARWPSDVRVSFLIRFISQKLNDQPVTTECNRQPLVIYEPRLGGVREL